MVPASGWGLLSLPPAACASIHQPLLYTTGVQAVPRERERGLPGRHQLWDSSSGRETGCGGIACSCSSQALHPAGLWAEQSQQL